MKKNPIIRSLIPPPLFLTAQLIINLILIPNVQVSARDSSAATFSIHKTNITLQELFDEIEKNSDYSFFYKNKEIDTREKVSVDATNASIDALLEQAFEGTNISFAIRNTSIVLSRKSASTGTSKSTYITVSGTVRDTEGERLAGVTVMVKGTTNGTVTDAYGEYQIRVTDANAELQFSFLGFEQQTEIVGRRTEINVTMRQGAHQVDDVVVVGYGTQKKASVVGSVQSIAVDKLRVPSSNLSTAFAGQLAGVIAVQRSGEPGADGADFWIRGISTFSGMTSPLIVIDGVKASSGDLNALDPEMIESFSILKDATATALYGSRGANGVMIVTTKSGRDLDKPHINVRVEGSYTMPTQVPKFVNGPRFMEMYNEALYSRSGGYARRALFPGEDRRHAPRTRPLRLSERRLVQRNVPQGLDEPERQHIDPWRRSQNGLFQQRVVPQRQRHAEKLRRLLLQKRPAGATLCVAEQHQCLRDAHDTPHGEGQRPVARLPRIAHVGTKHLRDGDGRQPGGLPHHVPRTARRV